MRPVIVESSPDAIRIMLVEDNEHDRIAFHRALEKAREPFQLQETERGEAALGRLSANPSNIDVVVADYDLPGLNGLELFEDLKNRIGEYRMPPFLMLTGAGSEEVATKALKLGIFDYVVKDPDNRYLKLIPPVLLNTRNHHRQQLAYFEAQRQLARVHRKLEKDVAERTADLARTVQSLKGEVEVRIKAEQALRESRRRLRDISLKFIEAQENDRKAIAHDLHDGIGGNLAAIKMSIESRIGGMNASPPSDSVSLETIVGYLKDTLTEVRRISARLRPKDMDSLGLKGAIRQLCRRIEEQYRGPRISWSLDVDEEDIPDLLQPTIYRIVQEALTNAARHASAESIRVLLEKRSRSVVLFVEDNGCGFDPEAIGRKGSGQSGFGIEGMRNRAELIEGTLHVTSTVDGGTCIHAILPLLHPKNPPGALGG